MYHTSFLNQRTGPSPGKPNLDPWSSGNCPGWTLNPQGNLECPGPQPPPEQLRWVSSTNILQRSSHTAMAELNLLSADVVSTLHCSSSQEPDEGHGIQPGLHSLCRYSYRLLPPLSPCKWTHMAPGTGCYWGVYMCPHTFLTSLKGEGSWPGQASVSGEPRPIAAVFP